MNLRVLAARRVVVGESKDHHLVLGSPTLRGPRRGLISGVGGNGSICSIGHNGQRTCILDHLGITRSRSWSWHAVYGGRARRGLFAAAAALIKEGFCACRAGEEGRFALAGVFDVVMAMLLSFRVARAYLPGASDAAFVAEAGVAPVGRGEGLADAGRVAAMAAGFDAGALGSAVYVFADLVRRAGVVVVTRGGGGRGSGQRGSGRG